MEVGFNFSNILNLSDVDGGEISDEQIVYTKQVEDIFEPRPKKETKKVCLTKEGLSEEDIKLLINNQMIYFSGRITQDKLYITLDKEYFTLKGPLDGLIFRDQVREIDPMTTDSAVSLWEGPKISDKSGLRIEPKGSIMTSSHQFIGCPYGLRMKFEEIFIDRGYKIRYEFGSGNITKLKLIIENTTNFVLLLQKHMEIGFIKFKPISTCSIIKKDFGNIDLTVTKWSNYRLLPGEKF